MSRNDGKTFAIFTLVSVVLTNFPRSVQVGTSFLHQPHQGAAKGNTARRSGHFFRYRPAFLPYSASILVHTIELDENVVTFPNMFVKVLNSQVDNAVQFPGWILRQRADQQRQKEGERQHRLKGEG